MMFEEMRFYFFYAFHPKPYKQKHSSYCNNRINNRNSNNSLPAEFTCNKKVCFNFKTRGEEHRDCKRKNYCVSSFFLYIIYVNIVIVVVMFITSDTKYKINNSK